MCIIFVSCIDLERQCKPTLTLAKQFLRRDVLNLLGDIIVGLIVVFSVSLEAW